MKNLIYTTLLLLSVCFTINAHAQSSSAYGGAFIPVDTANKMLESYLASINASSSTTELRSLLFDADMLRDMLNDTAKGRIARIKIMFAHTPAYINAGNKGEPCNYKSGALTLIIAGIDGQGNYIYNPKNSVMDTGMPCPSSCPTVGNASSDYLIRY